MTSKKQTLIRLGVFLLLAFGLAMIPQIICLAVFGYEKWMESPMAVVVTLSMFAPMLGNILTRLITKEGWDDCKLRLNLTGNLSFYSMGALIPVIWFLISAAIVNFAHGNWQFEGLRKTTFSESFTELMMSYVAFVPYYVFCCFGEEFGWRAYLNQKLETLTGTVGAVVFGGAIWGLWHGLLVANGYNFGSGRPFFSVVLMCVSCIFVKASAMRLTKKTDSVFPATLMHVIEDISLYEFIFRHVVSGVSEEVGSKATELQIGILLLVIPQVMVGTISFILLLRDKRKKPDPSADQAVPA